MLNLATVSIIGSSENRVFFRLVTRVDVSQNTYLFKVALKLKLRVLLAGHIVAMVTYCAIKLTATCSPMIVQCFDTIILVSTDIEWL